MEAKEFYDKTAHIYDKRHKSPTTEVMRRYERKILKFANGFILDLGCGTGYYLKKFSRIVGVDISKGMLNQAKKTKKPVVFGRAENLPFKDRTFDTVLCIFSVLNLADREKTVQEIYRVLKPKGMVLVSVASVYDRGYGFLEKFFFSPKTFPKTKTFRIYGNSLKMSLFTKKEFISLFTKNGFRLKKFYGIFILQNPKWNVLKGFGWKEKIKIFLDMFLPKEKGCIYLGVFEKYK